MISAKNVGKVKCAKVSRSYVALTDHWKHESVTLALDNEVVVQWVWAVLYTNMLYLAVPPFSEHIEP